MDFQKNLNPEQLQAVTAGAGPVLVLAGPGSGKTRVLTQRIVYLLASLGVRPSNLFAVTFTNKAAREMEARLQNIVGDNLRGLTLGTFHSICARILRQEAAFLPIQPNYVIFDQDDQFTLIKQVFADLNLDDKRYRPAAIHAEISNAKNELLLPGDYPVHNYRDEIVQRVYQQYQNRLLANNALDFDDLLLWTTQLFSQNPAVRDRYARRYEHILVDEFQDTNTAQYQLLRHLASFHKNIFVVGDADQSIYRWRGADYRNVLRFREDFPNSQTVLLEQNYRSKQAILDLATAVIDRNPQRTPKRLYSNLGQGQKPVLYEAMDDRLEAAYVVELIQKLIKKEKLEPGSFAVMYRTNAQSRLLEEAFLQSGLPYRLVGAQRFYGRKEIKDLIAYLRTIHNQDDELSLIRVINTPPRGIGEKTYIQLKTCAQQTKISPTKMLLSIGKGSSSDTIDQLSSRVKSSLQAFAALLARWVEHSAELSPLALMDAIIEDTGMQRHIDDGTEEGHDRWENVQELRRLAADYQEHGLEAFLERVALVSDQDTIQENASSPTLLTLHAAKGLEFPVVFITGLNDGLLPHSRSFEDPEAMQEERRLFYVGITRAKDQLFLTYSQNRSSFGYSDPFTPSRYLDEIPSTLIDEIQASSSPRKSFTPVSENSERWGSSQSNRSSARSQNPTSSKPSFSPGMRVNHPVWGEGMVLSSRIQVDDEIVDVFFGGVGLKHLAASLARLEIKS